MNTSKKAFVVGLASVTLGLTSLAASAAELLSPGTLKVGMEVTYPPFESYNGDKIFGFDPEVSALLAKQIGAKASFSDTKFTGLILGLASNKFDAVISGMYVTPAREKQAYAIPYARTGASIMVLKGGPLHPKTEKDLCGLKVGLQQGTTWVKALNELSDSYCKANGKPAIDVMEFPTAPEVAQALMSKNVQAQLEINGAAKMIVKKSRGRMEISSPDLVYPQTLGIYVKKGNEQLRDALKDALAAVTENGSFLALLKKYDLSPVSK